MELEILHIWSPDLTPTDGLPSDLKNFKIFIQVRIHEKRKKGEEVIHLVVCSPNYCKEKIGEFQSNTLILNNFNWTVIKEKILEKLQLANKATSWEEVFEKISPFLKSSDYD